MNMQFIGKLPIPQEIKAQYPLSEEAADIKIARDKEIRKIFAGEDDRMVLIIGPCSADREDAVLEYIGRLRLVQDKVADKLLIIPRIYTNKPRTTGEGAFKDVYSVMANWGANHGVTVYGHVGADLITLASMLRIPVTMHNVPEEKVYRPHSWAAFGTQDTQAADYAACKHYGPLYGKL